MSKIQLGKVAKNMHNNEFILVTTIDARRGLFSGVIVGKDSYYTTGIYSGICCISDFESMSKKESVYYINEFIGHLIEIGMINDATIRDLKESNEKLKKENKRLEQHCVCRKRGIEALTTKINSLKKLYQGEKNYVDELTESHLTLQEEKEALQEKVKQLTNADQELKQENKRLEQLCVERKECMESGYLEINRLRDKLQNSDALIQEGLKEKEELKEKVKQLTNADQELKQENERLTNANEAYANISNDYYDMITNLRMQIEEYGANYRKMRSDLDKANASSIAANKRAETFADEIGQLTKHSLKKEKELNDKYLRLAKAHAKTKKELSEATEILSNVIADNVKTDLEEQAFRCWTDFVNGTDCANNGNMKGISNETGVFSASDSKTFEECEKEAIKFTKESMKIAGGMLSIDYKTGYKEGIMHYLRNHQQNLKK